MSGSLRPFPTPPESRLRVLVVDDSDLQRMILANILNTDPGIEVVGQAKDGPEAIRLTASLHPDVIMIDLRMPGMDGLAATRRIMQETPTPVVLVSAGISPEDRQLVGEALAAGVLAVAAKPVPGARGAQATAELITTVKRMAGVRVIRRRSLERGNTGQLSPPQKHTNTGPLGALSEAPAAAPQGPRPAIVAIGSSTGGPQALQAILTRLPATFQPPIVIVQHIAAGFAAGVVDWLGPQCALPFQLATAGMRIDRPGIYLAPTGHHLVVRGHVLALSDEPPVRGHRPSATNLFCSVATSYGPRAIGVLLTGMGDDGAAGLAEMKRQGGRRSRRMKPARWSSGCRQRRSRSVSWTISSRRRRFPRCCNEWPPSRCAARVAGCCRRARIARRDRRSTSGARSFGFCRGVSHRGGGAFARTRCPTPGPGT